MTNSPAQLAPHQRQLEAALIGFGVPSTDARRLVEHRNATRERAHWIIARASEPREKTPGEWATKAIERGWSLSAADLRAFEIDDRRRLREQGWRTFLGQPREYQLGVLERINHLPGCCTDGVVPTNPGACLKACVNFELYRDGICSDSE